MQHVEPGEPGADYRDINCQLVSLHSSIVADFYYGGAMGEAST